MVLDDICYGQLERPRVGARVRTLNPRANACDAFFGLPILSTYLSAIACMVAGAASIMWSLRGGLVRSFCRGVVSSFLRFGVLGGDFLSAVSFLTASSPWDPRLLLSLGLPLLAL